MLRRNCVAPTSATRLLRAACRTVATATATATATAPTAALPPLPSLTSVSSRAQALESKATRELVRDLAVLQTSSIAPLVKAAPTLITLSSKVFGKFLTFDVVIGNTFFRQFCAGTNSASIEPTLQKLASRGIGCVLDYAVEADAAPTTKGAQHAPQRMESVLTSQPDYAAADLRGDAMDAKLRFVVESIADASRHRNRAGLAFTAVKVTALAPTELLRRVSALQLEARRAWHVLAGNPALELEECSGAASALDRVPAHVLTHRLAGDGKVDFLHAVGLSPLTTDPDATVSLLDFVEAVTELQTNKDPATAEPILSALGIRGALTPDERAMLVQTRGRMQALADAAVVNNVTLLVDAEQSYFQPAIDLFTREAQRTHNTTRPVLQATYQCYIKTMETRLANDLARAQQQGWVWGGKVVRGAYMVQERALAEKYGYASPIHETKAASDACYDRCARVILDHMSACPETPTSVLFGTHNAQSVQMITDVMAAQRENGGVQGTVCFGQLLGMADTLTIPLAHNGYNVFKYVPYGPVDEVVPYLVRRAQENASILMTADGVVERQLIRKELVRRLMATKVIALCWAAATLMYFMALRLMTRVSPGGRIAMS